MQRSKLEVRLEAAKSLNNLAWLCARCGERLDEAVSMSERAMALEPASYENIDTAASAYFAAGDFARAVQLEKRALNMRPCDPFMQRQLARFEKGAKDKN